MTIPLIQVNAFTDRPFAGNPAAVCLLPGPADDSWMQKVAAEINLSETAFLHHGPDGYSLRWFTPVVEVDLCGHATLASAHALWEQGYLQPDQPARFHTRSGLLICSRTATGIEMDFPAKIAEAAPLLPEMAKALGAKPRWVGRNSFDYLVELESEQDVRRLKPDFGLLATIPVRGTIVTAESSEPGYDFVSRFFAPASGVPEDPVTGSAHCCLGPFWAQRLGKNQLVGSQVSGRGGIVGVRVAGPRVYLTGRAVTVWRGELVA
jgi:PhzF family phenazine biosynthesis protein